MTTNPSDLVENSQFVDRVESSLLWECIHESGSAHHFQGVPRDFAGFCAIGGPFGIEKTQPLMSHCQGANGTDSSPKALFYVEVVGALVVKSVIHQAHYRGDDRDATANICVAQDTPENRQRFMDEHCREVLGISSSSIAGILQHPPAYIREVTLPRIKGLLAGRTL